MSNRLRVGILLAIGLVSLAAVAAYAADGDFAGRWKGEQKVEPAPARSTTAGSSATAESGASATSQQAAAAPPAGGGGRGGGGGFGGRGGGGFGGFGGGSGGGFGGGAQKVQMNLKQSKEGKLSGNITFGEGNALDVKDGKVEGNRITFSAGRSPEPIYAYSGEIKGDELILTRIAPAGGRGPQTTEFVLTKK
jgi:hypothetical protein